MRIGINGRFLIAKRTGVQRAAFNLLTTLIRVDRDNDYFIFTGCEQVGRPEWDYDNVTVVPSTIRSGESVRNHLWEQFSLPRLARRHRIDILHSPANVAPLRYAGKSIVHIHDLCFIVNPQWYSFSFRTLYSLVIPRLAKKATKVITNSNNSRNDLFQFFGLEANKVSLVYWAVDETFLRSAVTDSGKENLRHRISEVVDNGSQVDLSASSHDDYILYVGSLEPRKNIGTLVEAFEQLRDKDPKSKTKLVLIGGESPLFADVSLKIKRYKDDVIFKGFVDDQTLRDYYARAAMVAYPSLYEGFGLPPLEAMASGTPVVTSITSSIPEVVGDAAIMISPYDASQLAEGMALILKDPELRELLIRKGYEQVRRFNWYRVARNILAVYYEVHNGGKSFIPFELWKRLESIERDHVRHVFQGR